MAGLDSMAPALVGAMSATLGISIVFLLLRVVCKWRCGKKIGLDDHILVTSWVGRDAPELTLPPFWRASS